MVCEPNNTSYTGTFLTFFASKGAVISQITKVCKGNTFWQLVEELFTCI